MEREQDELLARDEAEQLRREAAEAKEAAERDRAEREQLERDHRSFSEAPSNNSDVPVSAKRIICKYVTSVYYLKGSRRL